MNATAAPQQEVDGAMRKYRESAAAQRAVSMASPPSPTKQNTWGNEMSRNSKNARQVRAAKQISKQRKGGSKGPSKTTKLHRKKNTWYAKKDGKLATRAQSVADSEPEE